MRKCAMYQVEIQASPILRCWGGKTSSRWVTGCFHTTSLVTKTECLRHQDILYQLKTTIPRILLRKLQNCLFFQAGWNWRVATRLRMQCWARWRNGGKRATCIVSYICTNKSDWWIGRINVRDSWAGKTDGETSKMKGWHPNDKLLGFYRP